ncbi:MAG: 4-hydroxy-tetrahydrodipicolinate reductase [Enterococcus sp.]
MKIGVIGNGRMGESLQQEIAHSRNVLILTEESIQTSPVKFATSIDVLIDFSHPDNLQKILTYAKQKHVPLVLGTTGYTNAQLEEIKASAMKIGILYSANFSLGVSVMQLLVQQATALLKEWDIELIEKHHQFKKDAPSGTAKQLVTTIQQTREITPVYGREGEHERQHNELGVHSIRAGSLPGEHEVLFASTDEVVSIKHEAFSRRIFAKGAIQAAQWLIKQPIKFYSLQDMVVQERKSMK